MKNDTGMLLFGMAMLLGMGFIIYKISASQTTMTDFVRDDQGRVIQIIEKRI